MMGQKKITVIIDKAGRPTIEAHGFTGQSCKKATKPIEDAFRGGDSTTTDKPEINLPEKTSTGMHMGT